ncbi:MAG: hypothetical protein HYY18_12160 [Planctomycetes bacterium]|nr:hypothetical protein [Planctomycetota bacterium]
MRRILAVAVMAALASTAQAGFKGGVYTNAEKGVRFRLGKGWKVGPAEENAEGGVCSFMDKGRKIVGIFAHRQESWKAKDHAKWRADQIGEAVSSVTWEREEKLEKEPGEWLRVDLSVDDGEKTWRTSHLYVANGKDNWELVLRCAEDDFEENEKLLGEILDSFELGEFKDEGNDPEEPAEPDEPSAQAAGGRVWVDAERGVGIRGGKGWTVVTDRESFKLGNPNEVFEFATGDDELSVCLCEMENDADAKLIADETVKALGKSFKKQKMLKGTAPEGTERRDFRVNNGDIGLRFTMVFFNRDGKVYWLQAIVAEAKWDAVKEDLEGCVASLKIGDVSALEEEAKKEPGDEPVVKEVDEPGAGEGEETLLPNPWEGYGKGSWVKYRMVSEAAGAKTEMEMISTLVDFDEESYTQRTDMVMNGTQVPGQETKINRRQKVPAGGGDAPKTEEGDETITVAKGEFACHWVKSTSEQGWSKVWTNKDVPMGTVKLQTEYAGSKSEMELLDFEKK